MEKRRFIDDYEVILLDMGNTFMFGCDRFGPDANCYATYQALGGGRLSGPVVSQIITDLFDLMVAAGRDPDQYNDFGAVRTYLVKLPESRDLPDSELEILEKVFARHEVGVIPDSHAEVIKELGRTHSLGVVSNIWSHRDVFEEELRRASIYHLFDTIVWSSDHGCIKPSPRLFKKALARFPVETSRILFVGDNLMRDVGGAKRVGMSAVWINAGHTGLSVGDPQPDLKIPELGRLLTK